MRGYPRFIYSNPGNTKSEGPFVVHTLFPKFIATYKMKGEMVAVKIIEKWDAATDDYLFEQAITAMEHWVHAQIRSGTLA